MRPGDGLVPIETPAGPADARMAWAEALNQLAVVTGVDERAGVVRVNVPSEGATYERPIAAMLAEYEPAGEESEFGRSWGAAITRAAAEAARVERARFEDDDAGYWQRVAAVVGRVLREETAA